MTHDTQNPIPETPKNPDFAGAFNAVHTSIKERLAVGELHRLGPEFKLPPHEDFQEQRDQLEETYGQLADHDRQNFGVRLCFIPPRHLVEFTDNPEENPHKPPKPLVEKFLRDFCGTTVKGLVYLEGISDNWELAITLGDWKRKATDNNSTHRPRDSRSREEREIDEMEAAVADLPSELREKAVDLFPAAYTAMGGVFDRPPDYQTTILARGRPRLLTREELAELHTPHASPADDTGEAGAPKPITYGHYIPKGERRTGGSFREAEIVISSIRPTHQVSFTPFHKKDVPFELRRRPTFVSRTT